MSPWRLSVQLFRHLFNPNDLQSVDYVGKLVSIRSHHAYRFIVKCERLLFLYCYRKVSVRLFRGPWVAMLTGTKVRFRNVYVDDPREILFLFGPVILTV